MYMHQQKKTKLADKQKENEETKKVHERANKRRKAHKGASMHVIKQNRVSKKDKCGFGLVLAVPLY